MAGESRLTFFLFSPEELQILSPPIDTTPTLPNKQSTMASTPAATSRRHCLSLALASLILADVSGQIIFIPTSMMSSPSSSSSFFSYPSSPSSSSPRGLLLGGGSVGIASSSTYDEPPCRQRRLEPFRQLVREECRADAEAHCRGGGGTTAKPPPPSTCRP